MSDINTEFDVIVVGAGVAGSTCAIQCAKQGLQTLLIERGKPIGSKNMSGGVLWGNDLANVLGENWHENAPVERYVVRKGVGFLSKEDAMIIDMRFPGWAPKHGHPANGWMLLRARFDPWLAKQAEEAGAEVHSGIMVENLAFDSETNNGNKPRQITGIIQQGDYFKAKAVILADGTQSRLAIDHGLLPEVKKHVSPLKQHHYLLGIKEVISLPKDVLEHRFNLNDEFEGAAYELVSGVHNSSARVGGFLYTNKSTVSLGVVIQLETVTEGMHTYTLYEEFKQHPWIQAFIKDGVRVEYGAKMVPHGGYNMLKKTKLYHPGALLIGDAAGFLLSNGMSILGMNYAIASGIVAADTLVEAKQRNDFSDKGLSRYQKKLQKSYFWKDLKRFRKVDKVLANPRIFQKYPGVITGLMKEALTEQGWKSTEKKTVQKPNLRQAAFKSLKDNKVNRIRAIFDALSARHL